jgi:hypothetical protein
VNVDIDFAEARARLRRPAIVLGPVLTIAIVVLIVVLRDDGGKAEASTSTGPGFVTTRPCESVSRDGRRVSQECGWWLAPDRDNLWRQYRGPLRDRPALFDELDGQHVLTPDQVHGNSPAKGLSDLAPTPVLALALILAAVGFFVVVVVGLRELAGRPGPGQ